MLVVIEGLPARERSGHLPSGAAELLARALKDNLFLPRHRKPGWIHLEVKRNVALPAHERFDVRLVVGEPRELLGRHVAVHLFREAPRVAAADAKGDQGAGIRQQRRLRRCVELLEAVVGHDEADAEGPQLRERADKVARRVVLEFIDVDCARPPVGPREPERLEVRGPQGAEQITLGLPYPAFGNIDQDQRAGIDRPRDAVGIRALAEHLKQRIVAEEVELVLDRHRPLFALAPRPARKLLLPKPAHFPVVRGPLDDPLPVAFVEEEARDAGERLRPGALEERMQAPLGDIAAARPPAGVPERLERAERVREDEG